MRVLALDLSKTSAGYACWGPGDDEVLSGRWVLGTSFTTEGAVYCELHARMTEINEQRAIEAVFIEEALDVRVLSGRTNIDSLKLLSGLNAHAKSWASAMDCRIMREVNQSKWRRKFLGKIPRGTRRQTLKDASMDRARQLGFKPITDDVAEAIGILTYALLSLQITPPWISTEVFRPPLKGINE